MRLVVTGGGTGGHVYPALEVALGAQRREWNVQYFGSIRGQEGDACQRVGLRFTAFASEPVYSLKTFRGLRALVRLYQASLQAGKALRREGAEAVFAKGRKPFLPPGAIPARRSCRPPSVLAFPPFCTSRMPSLAVRNN